MQRTVITGRGPVSALGVGLEQLMASIGEGRTAWMPSSEQGPIAAINAFDVEPFLKSRKAYLDRNSGLAMAAAALALADAGLDGSERPADDIGLLLGTACGNTATSELYYGSVLDGGPRAAKPVLFPHLYPNTAASLAAIEFNLGGMHAVHSAGWISGGAALIQGADAIAASEAEALLAGGADALHPLLVEDLRQSGSLSPRAGQAGGQPGVYSFDPRANGIFIGEGAGLLMLEAETRAEKRGAAVRAELAAGAIGSVDSATAAVAVMEQALERAGCSIKDIGWACAHAAADPVLDAWEGGALNALAAERSQALPVWTPAPYLGETMAAGAALQTILATALMPDGRLPPLPGNLKLRPEFANLIFPPVSCDPSAPILVNTLDPGGSLTVLILKPWPTKTAS